MKTKFRLKRLNPDDTRGLDKAVTKAKTAKLHERIGDLQPLLYANGTHAVLMIFQGIDASGKDGSVRSVLREVNPAGVEVANFKVPSEEERAHDFLWRVHRAVPRYGNIGVFNRSHYEAVLAERVLGIVPPEVWKPRYEQIVDWERMLAANKVVLLKFFLHLSREEQARRFRERLNNPKKHWKFSPADLDVRKRWDDYAEAFEDMLNQTSHRAAPWHVIPADHNWYRDHLIARLVVDTLEALDLKWPKAKADFSKVKID
ncbi:MAG TPA: PPK2 family polyphosphate kinase [Opitutus sp.]|nr:PPK2 family polyphosphate kinase [Opitutus sp.]